jgi:hypothetical protein
MRDPGAVVIVIGCDPGTERSAFVAWDGSSIHFANICANQDALDLLDQRGVLRVMASILVLEKVESYGMAVGETTFQTVFWSGRFAQAWSPRRFEQMGRRIVKQHLCYSARATDANIRQALIDRFGGKDKAIGKKATPGILYPLKGHTWAAFAVAITWHDQQANLPEQVRPGVRAEF